jgi:Asp-tRNA(Asn)/Glu-tRNA(Gln) amidotransferase A subunit family amidase
MHGIPVVIKDNFDTADMPTTAGSFLLKDSLPPDGAFLVKQLKDAGAIILGKLNLSEFASGDATKYPEFRVQITEYLATLAPAYPKTLAELISRAMELTATREGGAIPNPSRWALMMAEEKNSALDNYKYTAAVEHALPLIRATIQGLMESENLDAIVYPTIPTAAGLIESPPSGTASAGSG